MLRTALITALTLSACLQDETVAAFDDDQIWTLQEPDNSLFEATASLSFKDDGKVTGQAPCNTFFTEQTKPYPWIGFGPIGTTRMICTDIEAEKRFLSALMEMTLVEVSGEVMILSNDAGRQMLFKATQGDG